MALIAFAVVAHHGAAAPLPGASGHGAHGVCQDCREHGETAAAGLLAICLGIAATGVAFARIAGAVSRLRRFPSRARARDGGARPPTPPRPPPRPPELARLCVLLR